MGSRVPFSWPQRECVCVSERLLSAIVSSIEAPITWFAAPPKPRHHLKHPARPGRVTPQHGFPASDAPLILDNTISEESMHDKRLITLVRLASNYAAVQPPTPKTIGLSIACLRASFNIPALPRRSLVELHIRLADIYISFTHDTDEASSHLQAALSLLPNDHLVRLQVWALQARLVDEHLQKHPDNILEKAITLAETEHEDAWKIFFMDKTIVYWWKYGHIKRARAMLRALENMVGDSERVGILKVYLAVRSVGNRPGREAYTLPVQIKSEESRIAAAMVCLLRGDTSGARAYLVDDGSARAILLKGISHRSETHNSKACVLLQGLLKSLTGGNPTARVILALPRAPRVCLAIAAMVMVERRLSRSDLPGADEWIGRLLLVVSSLPDAKDGWLDLTSLAVALFFHGMHKLEDARNWYESLLRQHSESITLWKDPDLESFLRVSLWVTRLGGKVELNELEDELHSVSQVTEDMHVKAAASLLLGYAEGDPVRKRSLLLDAIRLSPHATQLKMLALAMLGDGPKGFRCFENALLLAENAKAVTLGRYIAQRMAKAADRVRRNS